MFDVLEATQREHAFHWQCINRVILIEVSLLNTVLSFLLFFLRQEGSSVWLRKGKKRSFQSIFLRSLNSPCYPHTLRRNSGVSFSFYSELLFQIAHPESHSSLYAAGSLNPKFTFFD